MRRSSKKEEMQLPPDTYEGWLRAQSVRHTAGAPEVTPAKDSYETWLEIRVEKQRMKAAGKK
ncbi:MAG: hypothetical protein ABSB56_05080 [Nitrososphaerales archaeon]